MNDRITETEEKYTFVFCTSGDHHQASSSGYRGIRGNVSHGAKTSRNYNVKSVEQDIKLHFKAM